MNGCLRTMTSLRWLSRIICKIGDEYPLEKSLSRRALEPFICEMKVPRPLEQLTV